MQTDLCAPFSDKMDVVPPELNSLLPDEIMDTEAIVTDDDLPAVCPAPPNALERQDTPVPMETEVPEIVTLCTAAPSIPVQRTQAMTTLTSTDSTPSSGSMGTQLLLTPSSSAMTLQPSSPQVTGSLQRLSTSLALPANHQLILNKVAASPGSELKPQLLKQDGQKLVVTTLGKGGQPIVLAMPHSAAKAGTLLSAGDGKGQPQQFKVVTIGGRTDLKPMVGVQALSTASQLMGTSQTVQQGQHPKTLQVSEWPWIIKLHKAPLRMQTIKCPNH